MCEGIGVQSARIIEEQWKLTTARVDEWVQNDLLKLNWWILLALFVLTAYLWWKTVDKTRLNEMVLYTALIVLFIIVLDELGEELSLWYYTTDVIPLFPPLTAMDITSMPIVYMLVYQYFRTWKRFIIVTVAMAGVFCFVFEPIFVWSGVYKLLIWQSYYGFPIYIFIAAASKFIVQRICSVSYERQIPR